MYRCLYNGQFIDLGTDEFVAIQRAKELGATCIYAPPDWKIIWLNKP